MKSLRAGGRRWCTTSTPFDTDSGQLVMDPEGLGSADLSIPSASPYQATANILDCGFIHEA